VIYHTTFNGERAMIVRVSRVQLYVALAIVVVQAAVSLLLSPTVAGELGPLVAELTPLSESAAWYVVITFWYCVIFAAAVHTLRTMKQLKIFFIVTKSWFRRVMPSGHYDEGQWSEFSGVLKRPYQFRFGDKTVIPLNYWETARPSKREMSEILAFAEVDRQIFGVDALVMPTEASSEPM
jgi:hypothetical protein